MKRGQRLLRGSLRAGAGGLLVVIVMAAVLWGTFALWFALPAEAGARLIVKGQDLFPKGDWGITGVAYHGTAPAQGRLWLPLKAGAQIAQLVTEPDQWSFRLEKTFSLQRWLPLPKRQDDYPAIEAIDFDGSDLWVCGSHTVVHRKPRPGDDPETMQSKIVQARRWPNRCLLARMSMPRWWESPGSSTSVRSSVSVLRMDPGPISPLIKALEKHEVLSGFLRVPRRTAS